MSYDSIAELYEAAFSWESDPALILPIYERLGRPQRTLEIACGPAGFLASLVAEGTFGIGIDVSAPMVALARRRLGTARPGGFDVLQADMRDFSLDAPVGGAFCAVGSFAHLTIAADATRHLTAMRAALAPGAAYAVQIGLQPLSDSGPHGPNEHSTWEFECDGERLTFAWFGRGIDAAGAREIQVSRIEWLSGPRRGEVVETEHDMHVWDWRSWSELLASAGFTQIAALDPDRRFEEVPLGEALYERPLAWHLITAG